MEEEVYLIIYWTDRGELKSPTKSKPLAFSPPVSRGFYFMSPGSLHYRLNTLLSLRDDCHLT